ncbi:MAG: hypothetical protein ACD_55C00094G0009 [uncultured bacterium]|uniref:Uncharacterized protein n=1 Tax=Citrifermentans bemidjiense (strain ATCC BAA-1014 / DSM 16622 / JCM 12645 / Bem) TaxID=404380 RepID=B5EC16_CITBB|nr:hypothetical protein [Citrifermentans bemidjiense]ACH40472.1 hypothetical protein Gbem_3479 [Citrifermentans bemidjiense Bem]EKD59273.1 MAG: hypothetical protein ACD_55C00094G0009 [uncultured bacterium]
MLSVTINSYVFERQNSSLTHLADAIKGIGWRVQALTNNLPGSCKNQVLELLDRELSAIDSTCHCLGEVALGAGCEAEEWALWAEHTGINITFNWDEKAETVGSLGTAGDLVNNRGNTIAMKNDSDVAAEKITVEKIGRIIKETFDAGYSENDGKVLSDCLQEIYMRIFPNAMNPAYPELE